MSYLPIGRSTKDLTGRVFGRLTALGIAGHQARAAMWECRCECGALKTIRASSLLNGHSKSCGCLRQEKLLKAVLKHGKTYDRVYSVWHNMLQRCTNPNSVNWKDYGGRGIEVCPSWLTFTNFYADMGDPPEGTEIDRRDNNGNYCKDNCAWVSRIENSRNKRNTVNITFNGTTACLQKHVDGLGVVSRGTVATRLRRGWTVEAALTTPVINH